MLKKWNRIGASVIDFSIIIVFFQLTYKLLLIPFGSYLAFRGAGAPLELVLDVLRIFFRLGWFVFIAVGYNYLLFIRYKSTLGKMLLRVHLVDEKSTDKKLVEIDKSQLIKRELYKWTFCIGTIWLYGFYSVIQIIISKDYKGYHNKVAHTKIEVWI